MTEQELKFRHLAIADRALAEIRDGNTQGDLATAAEIFHEMFHLGKDGIDVGALFHNRSDLLMLAAQAIIVVRAQLQERE